MSPVEGKQEIFDQKDWAFFARSMLARYALQGFSSTMVCLQAYSSLFRHMVVFVRSWFGLGMEDKV